LTVRCGGVAVSVEEIAYISELVHLLCNLCTLTLLFILCINGLLFLLHELSLVKSTACENYI
jgi:hypothetical protein